MKAVTIRVNDVEGVAGFVLPGDHVDVVLTRQTDKDTGMNDVIIQDVRVLAVDQSADVRAEKASVAKAVTLEVDVEDAQKLSLASSVGTLSLLLRKAGEVGERPQQRVTLNDLWKAFQPKESPSTKVVVTRPMKAEPGFKYDQQDVPVEHAGHAAALPARQPARD
jgi:pilus assembly protein CpaB